MIVEKGEILPSWPGMSRAWLELDSTDEIAFLFLIPIALLCIRRLRS